MNFKEIRLLNLKILILLLKLLIAILAIRSTPQRDFQQAHGHGDHAYRRIWLEMTQICIL